MEYLVAIVEDQQEEAALLEGYFHRYAASASLRFHIKHFHNGAEFISNYRPIYDLVMMDIHLPRCSGLEAAAQLRQMDPSVALVFVTSMIQYAARGYEVDVLDFLLKPVSYQNFQMKFQRILHRIDQNQRSDLLVPVQDGLQRIQIPHIKYIEVSNHSLIYHTTNGDVTTRGKLSALEAQLERYHFIRCNRCYLVNPAFVRALEGYVLVVDTDQLQISRPKRNAVMEALNHYFSGGV